LPTTNEGPVDNWRVQLGHPPLTGGTAVLLFAAGVGGGLSGSVAGLASLVTYPALLAAGLPPVAANVTNTVSLVGSGTGSIIGSRPELAGRQRELQPFVFAGVVGGVLGGGLLLLTPASTFAYVVPWLVALAAIAVLFQRELADDALRAAHVGRQRARAVAAVGVISVYGGYFGAGAGVLLLAALLWATGESVPRVAAAKNVVLAAANLVAATAFAVFAPVRWGMVAPLGLGALVGGRIGPIVVRRSNPFHLRIAIGLAGVGLALKLGADAYL
jgi:uncharacterized membrane protein YfcA